MQNLLKLFLAMFFIIHIQGCFIPDIQKSMVHFDQAFIAVYYDVWLGNLPNAQKKLIHLEMQWEQLQHDVRRLLPEDVDWRDGFQRADVAFQDAKTGIHANMKAFALNELDHVKYDLMEIRQLKGVPYYLDYLYDFQGSVEEVYEIAEDDMLCLLEWDEFELMVIDLNEKWQLTRDVPVDRELFELTEMEATKLGIMRQWITTQMKDVMHTLACGNHLEVAKRVAQVNNTFMKMLSGFGKVNIENEEAVSLNL